MSVFYSFFLRLSLLWKNFYKESPGELSWNEESQKSLVLEINDGPRSDPRKTLFLLKPCFVQYVAPERIWIYSSIVNGQLFNIIGQFSVYDVLTRFVKCSSSAVVLWESLLNCPAISHFPSGLENKSWIAHPYKSQSQCKYHYQSNQIISSIHQKTRTQYWDHLIARSIFWLACVLPLGLRSDFQAKQEHVLSAWMQ